MPRAKTPTRTPRSAWQKQELINDTRRLRKKATVSQLKAAFKDYDLDGDGKITTAELGMALRRLSAIHDAIETDEGTVRRMLADADVDGDGGISENEFVDVMMSIDSGRIELNWEIVNACASAEVTLKENKETMDAAFEKIASVGRQYSFDFQRKVSHEPRGEGLAEAGAIPRLFTLGLDLAYTYLVFLSMLALSQSVDGVDFNFLWFTIGKLFGTTEVEKNISFAQDYLVDPFLHLLEDALDASSFVVSVSAFGLLVGVAAYGIFSRSQTVGQIIMNHVPVSREDTEKRLGPLTAMIYYLLSMVSLDYFTGLAGTIMHSKVAHAWDLNETHATETKDAGKTAVKTAPERTTDGTSLAEMVHTSWMDRSFSNVLVVIVYAAFTYYLNTEVNKLLGDKSAHESRAREILGKYPFFAYFAQIPDVIFANKGLMASVVAIAIAVASAVILLCRAVLRPIIYCLVFGWTVATFYTAFTQVGNAASAPGGLISSYQKLEGGVQLLQGLAVSVMSLRYVYQRRAGFELQISAYQEAILSTTVHPLLAMVVPCCECAFQIYQFELLARVVALDFQGGDGMLPIAMIVHLYWTLFATRSLFEMACSGTIGRYYYRKSAEGSNSISRTIDGVLSAFVKNVGTGLAFGLIHFPIMVLYHIHKNVKKSYDDTSWVNFPVKVVLFVVSTMLAIVLAWVEALVSTAVTYAGITGEGVWSSGRRAFAVMRSDGVTIMAEHSGTKQLACILVSGACVLSAWLMEIAWEPLKAHFGATATSSSYSGGLFLCTDQYRCEELEKGIKGVCFFCMLYLCISMIWVLERASSTINVCMFDEMCHDPERLTHAPVELKKRMKEYMTAKNTVPSVFWDAFVLLIWGAASAGLTVLFIEEKIPPEPYRIALVVLMALAIRL